jgi:methyltransferase (TIGR00027 family)
MAQVKVELHEAMETALITLYGRAIDSRLSPTVLGDTMAAQAVEKIDYDFTRLQAMDKVAPNAAARAKHFDDWTSQFLAMHDRATVVHLGAGLDSRVWRVDPGPGVSWYDVDYPEVIETRRRLFPDRENYRMIACSVTSPEWLDQVPADRPTLIVAEGLTMYLRPEDGHELFRRIADRFPGGVVAFDAHNRLGIRMVNKGLTRFLGTPLLHWGIDDPHELERVDPRFHCTDAVSALLAPSAAGLALNMRIFAQLTRPIRAVRNLAQYLHYEIDDGTVTKLPAGFTGVRVTALLELYLRWLDSKDRRPILGDRWAGQVVRRLDFDFAQFSSLGIGRFAVGVRSRLMDKWTAEFLAANPDAIVVDLGCGFDSRVFRVDPPPGHHWYDVDFPDIVAITERLYPDRAEHTTVGVSVLDPDWLARIPGDRPVIVVADGLFGFLTGAEVRRVFQQIVDHFPRGEIVFNIVSSLVKNQRERRPVPLFTKFGITENWVLDDMRGAEEFDHRLHYVDGQSQVEAPLLAHAPLYYRALCALIRTVPAWRNSGWILRYRF